MTTRIRPELELTFAKAIAAPSPNDTRFGTPSLPGGPPRRASFRRLCSDLPLDLRRHKAMLVSVQTAFADGRY
jgi:hypothetical protein